MFPARFSGNSTCKTVKPESRDLRLVIVCFLNCVHLLPSLCCYLPLPFPISNSSHGPIGFFQTTNVDCLQDGVRPQ